MDTFAQSYIIHCKFSKNIASLGGVVYAQTNNNPVFLVDDCSFSDNIGKLSAGALLLAGPSLIISSSEFSSNMGNVGSTIFLEGEKCCLYITETKFENNDMYTNYSKPDHASSIYVSIASKAVFNKVYFVDNKGGGITFDKSKGEIKNCSFLRNTGVLGGAIVTSKDTPILVTTNTLFVGNRAPVGAAMRLFHPNTVVQSSYFVDNIAAQYPATISVVVQKMLQLRLSENVFCTSSSESYSQCEIFIGIGGESLSVGVSQSAELYFWQTSYKFNNKHSILIDRNFLQNDSMPRIIQSEEGIQTVEKFSHFASGKHKTEK